MYQWYDYKLTGKAFEMARLITFYGEHSQQAPKNLRDHLGMGGEENINDDWSTVYTNSLGAIILRAPREIAHQDLKFLWVAGKFDVTCGLTLGGRDNN